jgi:hypothetical protein
MILMMWLHRTIEVIVNNQIVSISASDTPVWQPQNSGPNTEYLEDGVTLLNTQFPNIGQGIVLNNGSEYFFYGTATRALYADLAERYHADAVYEYGTVVKIGGEKEITATSKEYCPDVFGVVSDNPAFGMNTGAGTSKTHPFVRSEWSSACSCYWTSQEGRQIGVLRYSRTCNERWIRSRYCLAICNWPRT